MLGILSCLSFSILFAESIMEPYLRHLYTYVSISGPHLGYLYSSNSLFNSGMWLLKKLKGTQCIHQLTFTDDPDLRNTFFYKLCKVLKEIYCAIKFVFKLNVHSFLFFLLYFYIHPFKHSEWLKNELCGLIYCLNCWAIK